RLAADGEALRLLAGAGAIDLIGAAAERRGEGDRRQAGRQILLLADDAVAVLLVTAKVTGPACAVLWSRLQVPPLSPVKVMLTWEAPFATGARASSAGAPGASAVRVANP